MGRLGTAFRLFFKAIGSGDFATKADEFLNAPETPLLSAAPAPAAAKTEAVNQRSDALNLLQVLQREARLIDFLMEPIDGYEDAQIGAAVRNIHRDAASILKRLFSLKPVLAQQEGSQVQVPAGVDSARYRLTGNVAGKPPFSGILRHAGWEAEELQLPVWNGSSAAATVVAPAEVEIV